MIAEVTLPKSSPAVANDEADGQEGVSGDKGKEVDRGEGGGKGKGKNVDMLADYSEARGGESRNR